MDSRSDIEANALAETPSGLYKAELIHRRAPWKTREALELATLEWVSRFNDHRLLEPIGCFPPDQAEANVYRQLAGKTGFEVSIWTGQPSRNPGDSVRQRTDVR